ncbi:contact-dependent growth inhibition system immunity protein [Mesorhizobium sp. M0938]|uniref:contact-dependent growth inhibition system immunity protein n=1 Tax=unclassified Mesorhizobium TaxID=325217 RepID=UPI00333D20F5
MKPRGNLDEDRPLNVLLGWKADQPPYPTSLVEHASIALATPLRDLTNEQVRLLVSQGFGLEYVVPKAISILVENPLIGVTFYDGDLLTNCLKIPHRFWMENQHLWVELDGILRSLDQTMSDVAKHRPRFESAWEAWSSQDTRSKKT